MLKRLPEMLLPTTLKLLLLAILSWLVLLAQAAWADMNQTQALEAGKQLGNTASSTALPTVDANTLPGFTTDNPPETQYQSAGIGLEDTARAHLLTADPDSPEGTVFNSISTRPQFSINRDDPLVQHTDSLIADAENAQDAGTGTACKTLTVTDPPSEGTEQCMEYLKTVDSTCKRTLTVTSSCGSGGGISPQDVLKNLRFIAVAGSITKQVFSADGLITIAGANACNAGGGGCVAMASGKIEFTLDDPSQLTSFYVTGIAMGSAGGYFYINGVKVRDVYARDGTIALGELRQHFRQGLNTIVFQAYTSPYTHYVAHYGMDARVTVKQCTPVLEDAWTDSCSAFRLDPLCELQTSICSDSSNPRVIDGVSVSRDCWEYTDSYRCYDQSGGKGEDDYCQELRDAGCTQSGSTCVDYLYGRCIAWEQTYQCSVPGKSRTVEDCSAANYCQDGNCFDSGYEANADFGLAASYMSSAEAMAKDMDGSFNIFTGNPHKCKKVVLGFKNCCKNSGWGLSFNLSQCSESEKILGEKRGAGMCHYLGSYKDNSLFPNRYDSYCCFNSKLARIIHEQGRPYVPLAWGSAKSPVCRGFTPEELQKIDFGQIDFSEFFADALAQADKAIKPSSGALGGQIQDKILRLLPQ